MKNRFFFTSFLLLAIAGCTFHSSQLDTVRAILNPPKVAPENYWLLQLGESKIPLARLSDDENHSTFVNSDGINISYDGTEVTFVSSWPEGDSDIRISRDADVLTYQMAGENGGTIEARCSEWQMVDSLSLYSECQSISGPTWSFLNEIQVGASGRAVRLKYGIWPGLSPVELIWFPVSGESTLILPYISE